MRTRRRDVRPTPVSTALVTSVGKCVVSDVAVQMTVEGKRLDEVDRRRVFCFAGSAGGVRRRVSMRVVQPADETAGDLSGAVRDERGVATMVLDQFVVCTSSASPFFGLKQWSSARRRRVRARCGGAMGGTTRGSLSR